MPPLPALAVKMRSAIASASGSPSLRAASSEASVHLEVIGGLFYGDAAFFGETTIELSRQVRLSPAGIDHVIADLIRADCDSWTVFREEMWKLTSAFKVADGRTPNGAFRSRRDSRELPSRRECPRR